MVLSSFRPLSGDTDNKRICDGGGCLVIDSVGVPISPGYVGNFDEFGTDLVAVSQKRDTMCQVLVETVHSPVRTLQDAKLADDSLGFEFGDGISPR